MRQTSLFWRTSPSHSKAGLSKTAELQYAQQGRDAGEDRLNQLYDAISEQQ
jgi:hypothetical protein